MTTDTSNASKTIPDELADLVAYLDSLSARADVEKLGQILRQNRASIETLQPFIEFGPLTYRRNLIRQSEWYELLCICWQSGQRSPIHDHAQSTCGLKIMTGVATETLFETTDCGQIKAVGSTDLEVGEVCSTQDADIHQVSNLQSSGSNLVTMHIYSPPIRCMDTYTLTGAEPSIYVPKNANVVCEIGDCI